MIKILFGEKIKELRNGEMLSQEELALKAGIERSQISKIEQGKANVTLETIDKLSTALNVPLSQLMDIERKYIIHPFLKWAGGKSQIINKLKHYLPNPTTIKEYYEPFFRWRGSII